MTWAEEYAAGVAPTSKYGVLRWINAFRLLETMPAKARESYAQFVADLDRPDLARTLVTTFDELYGPPGDRGEAFREMYGDA